MKVGNRLIDVQRGGESNWQLCCHFHSGRSSRAPLSLDVSSNIDLFAFLKEIVEIFTRNVQTTIQLFS
jgi:hypothetical protein